MISKVVLDELEDEIAQAVLAAGLEDEMVQVVLLVVEVLMMGDGEVRKAGGGVPCGPGGF